MAPEGTDHIPCPHCGKDLRETAQVFEVVRTGYRATASKGECGETLFDADSRSSVAGDIISLDARCGDCGRNITAASGPMLITIDGREV